MPCNVLHCRHLAQVCHLSPTFLQDLLTADPLYPQPCSSVVHSLHGPSTDSLNPTSGLIPSLFKPQWGSTSFTVRPSFRNSLQGLSWAGLLYPWPSVLPASHQPLWGALDTCGCTASPRQRCLRTFALTALLCLRHSSPSCPNGYSLTLMTFLLKGCHPVMPTPNHWTENTHPSSPFLVMF